MRYAVPRSTLGRVGREGGCKPFCPEGTLLFIHGKENKGDLSLTSFFFFLHESQYDNDEHVQYPHEQLTFLFSH